MTLPIAVIDTNVVVSGLLTGERAAPTATVLEGMVRGRFAYLLSLDLLAEYRKVLPRPGISRRHGLGDADVESILTELALNGRVCQPPPVAGAVPDPGDRDLWALLESDRGAVLVNGDAALQRHAPRPAESCPHVAFSSSSSERRRRRSRPSGRLGARATIRHSNDAEGYARKEIR